MEHSGGRAATEKRKKYVEEFIIDSSGRKILKMKQGILPKKVTKRSGFTKWGTTFWIGKKRTNGAQFKHYAGYNLSTRNLICIGETFEDVKQKIEKKYIKYMSEDIR